MYRKIITHFVTNVYHVGHIDINLWISQVTNVLRLVG